MNPFAWLFSIVALEAVIYLVVFWLWRSVAALGLARLLRSIRH
jgi:hypothetical protein